MRPHSLLIAGLSLVVSLLATRSYALEFCDDFRKPSSRHRDPYEERIETERHDFTQSAVTVGRGVAQIEGGYSYFDKDSLGDRESSHTTPEMLLRVGLTEDIEFRVRWNYAWVFIEDEPHESGAEDLRYSLKLQITREDCGGLTPTSALEVRGSAPTASDTFSTGRVEFSLDYIYLWTLSEGVTLTGSTGWGTNGFGDFGLVPTEPASERFNVLSQSAVLSFELNEANTMYVEWFGVFSEGLDNEYVVSVFNIGLDYYVTDNFVLDVRAGVGLSQDSDDFFTGIGGGYRF